MNETVLGKTGVRLFGEEKGVRVLEEKRRVLLLCMFLHPVGK